MRLKDQVVIITGGARGIGACTAERFIEEGAKVVIADVLEDEAKKTIQYLSEKGGKVDFIKTDISKLDQIKKMIDFTISKFGKLDVLVNNAGIQIRVPSIDFSENDWDRIVDVNLKAVFFASQMAAKEMIKQGSGKMVNISSCGAFNHIIGRAPYCITKLGVKGLTEALACEWAKYGIRINSIAPGWIHTQMVEDGFKKGVINKRELLSVTPMRRLASTREIADGVIYLASDEASFVNGHCLIIDGGWTPLGVPQRFDDLSKEELSKLLD
jgi:NAD(P)-dependent dehydrogenase (short-subunit alcohol dehydrogenase family)